MSEINQIEKVFRSCTIHCEESMNRLRLPDRLLSFAISVRDFIAGFPQVGYTQDLLPSWSSWPLKRPLPGIGDSQIRSGSREQGEQTSSRLETGQTSCLSAHSNLTAAVVARSTASSFAWLPRPEPLYLTGAAPRAATRSPSLQASATSRAGSRYVQPRAHGSTPSERVSVCEVRFKRRDLKTLSAHLVSLAPL